MKTDAEAQVEVVAFLKGLIAYAEAGHILGFVVDRKADQYEFQFVCKDEMFCPEGWDKSLFEKTKHIREEE